LKINQSKKVQSFKFTQKVWELGKPTQQYHQYNQGSQGDNSSYTVLDAGDSEEVDNVEGARGWHRD
jgi:hypothetical protein